MKKSTLAKIVKLIGNEKMDSEDIKKVMNAIRKQDEVVGDIVVCRDDLMNIASVHFIDRMSDDDAETIAYEVLEMMDLDRSINYASETFWDALIDDIDDMTRDFVV